MSDLTESTGAPLEVQAGYLLYRLDPDAIDLGYGNSIYVSDTWPFENFRLHYRDGQWVLFTHPLHEQFFSGTPAEALQRACRVLEPGIRQELRYYLEARSCLVLGFLGELLACRIARRLCA